MSSYYRSDSNRFSFAVNATLWLLNAACWAYRGQVLATLGMLVVATGFFIAWRKS